MTTLYLPPERVQYWHDADGILSVAKREDAIVPLIIDWSDLAGSATISSVAYDDSGVTRTSTSNTTTISTTYVTGTGETEVTVTLSDTRKLQKVFRFYNEETNDWRPNDYRD